MKCETTYFSGAADCSKLLSRVVGIKVVKKGNTFTDSTFVSFATEKQSIASSTLAERIAMVYPLKNYERTTDDPEVQTSNLGNKDQTQDNPPSMAGWLKMSAEDYKLLHDLEGTDFDIELWLANGTKVGTKKSNGAIRGFRGQIATRKDLPPSDNAQSSYPVNIYFQNAEEFKNVYYGSPDYYFSDVIDLIPVGLNVEITTPYATGTGIVVVKITKRATNEPMLGVTLEGCEILESNGTAPVAVTALTENGLGSYDLTINQDTGGVPAALASDDWYKLQISVIDTTFVTYLSNIVKETVA